MSEEIIEYQAGDGALAAVNEGQRAMLTQRTPREVIKTRPGKGGQKFTYVPHAWVTEKLNEAFYWAWSWEITDWRLIPEGGEPQEVFVLGKLSVRTPHGDIVKTQFGSATVKRDRKDNILSVGDDLKAASSDALKKAASLLGIALDLYKGDVRPSDDDERAIGGTISDDPTTAYWAAAKAKGMTRAEGAALLKKHKGNPDKALQEIASENGGGSDVTVDDVPTKPKEFLNWINQYRQDPFDNIFELRNALNQHEGFDGKSWPSGDSEWYSRAAKIALEHVRQQ